MIIICISSRKLNYKIIQIYFNLYYSTYEAEKLQFSDDIQKLESESKRFSEAATSFEDKNNLLKTELEKTQTNLLEAESQSAQVGNVEEHSAKLSAELLQVKKENLHLQKVLLNLEINKAAELFLYF